MTTFRKFSGGPPPRTLSALAALATTLVLHAGVLGLFQRAAAEPAWLLASPAVEPAPAPGEAPAG